jgi:hypothetical protein
MSAGGKFILRSGGFGAVFLSLLGGLFLVVAAGAARQGPGRHSALVFVPEVVFVCGLGLWLLEYVWAQKIEIDDRALHIRFLFGTAFRPVTRRIPLADIEEIILGSIGARKKRPDLMRAPALRDMIGRYESMRNHGVSMRPAVQFTPLIVVRTADSARAQVVPTKLFSRRGCRALMAASRKRGIKVTGDEKL